MTSVVLVEASPRDPTTGVPVDYRLAGGGSKPYFQAGFADWRSGVADPSPAYATALDFGEAGFTGGAVPQSVAIRFYTVDNALRSELANLYWPKARVQIRTGNDEAASPSYAVEFVGRCVDMKCQPNGIALTLADMSSDLDKPVCPNTFAGTGGIEGGADAEGRVKRRSWGLAFNVEGRLLDAATLTYEFGDPNFGVGSIPAVKDKGVTGSASVVVAWAGSPAATLAALQAATVPAGGYAVAPSIQCARWYTTPVGPLTADLDMAGGGGDYAPSLAAAIVSEFSTEITIANTAAAIAWQSGRAGIHVDSSTETIGSALDRLLTFNSTLWIVGLDATLTFRQAGWVAPTASIKADTIEREVVFAPLKTRKLGYQKNHRVMSDAEVSATIAANVRSVFTDEALYVVRDVALAASRWGDDAVTSTVVSSLATQTAAAAEAATQAIFLHGPLARDKIRALGSLRDLIGTVVTVTGTGLGYLGGADVFVIGVQEDPVLPISTLTVLKRL